MGDNAGIAWTNATWNPVSGCEKVSLACRNCYAERDWARLANNPKTVYFGRKFTEVACHPERLDQPLRWGKPRMIFVNSMSDLFHADVPFEFIDQVFAVMSLARDHTFQVLTKRPERMVEYMTTPGRVQNIWAAAKVLREQYKVAHFPTPAWPFPNVWMGVSVENQATAEARIPLLLKVPAAVRWISAEPLLGPVQLDKPNPRPSRYDEQGNGIEWTEECTWLWKPGIDWVVAGGESGAINKSRPMNPEWARSLRDQCAAAGVPFFFKQSGAWERVADTESAGAMQKDRLKDFPAAGGLYLHTRGGGQDLLDGETHMQWPTARAGGQ